MQHRNLSTSALAKKKLQ